RRAGETTFHLDGSETRNVQRDVIGADLRRGGACLTRRIRERRILQERERSVVIPIGHEQLRLLVGGARRRPRDLFSVGRKDRETIESVGERDALRMTLALGVDEIEL